MKKSRVDESVRVMLETKSCAASQISVICDMVGCENPNLPSAVSVLSGGVLSKGSTCGVVSSAALGLALLMDSVNNSWGVEQQVILHSYLKKYHDNFEEKYSSTLCRDRTQINLRSKLGLLKYILLPSKVKTCIKHCKGSMQFVTDHLEEIRGEVEELTHESIDSVPHCASTVMRRIREISGLGDELIERLVISLDGGVGLQGGACGALSGALISLNIDETGHMLYTPSLKRKRKKEFAVDLIEEFVEKYGSIECSRITGMKFESLDDFVGYRKNHCEDLVDFLVGKICSYLEEATSR